MSRKIKILCSDTAFITYPFVKQLNLSKINLLNLNLNIPHVVDPFTSHAALIGKTVPFQLSLINQFLYEEDISIEKVLFYLMLMIGMFYYLGLRPILQCTLKITE
ncbi:hypothetical protein OBG91_13600 [Lactococcus lactis]|nr:hypothetical protein [Lactococcus lactis]